MQMYSHQRNSLEGQVKLSGLLSYSSSSVTDLSTGAFLFILKLLLESELVNLKEKKEFHTQICRHAVTDQ